MNNVKFTYEYVKKYIEEKGYVLLSDTYIKNSVKLKIQDKDGYLYFLSFKVLKLERSYNKFDKNNPFTIQNIKLWCKLNNKPFELISDTYKNSHGKLQFKCLKEDCNEIFEKSWNSIIGGQGCGYCDGKQVSISNCLATLNPQLTSQWHSTKNGELTPFDVTCGSGKNVWWICDKGHEWQAVINIRCNLNRGCPYCSGTYPSNDNNLLFHNPTLCLEWDYDLNKKKPEEYTPMSSQKVYWKCTECGHKWKATINGRNGRLNGCPKCNESKGEKEISKILVNNKIISIPQSKFKDCKYIRMLPFDHYIPNLNTCIEYQGRQHYEVVDFSGNNQQRAEKQFELIKIRDQIKRDYCKNNNIKLLEIPYWDFDNIEKILKKELCI